MRDEAIIIYIWSNSGVFKSDKETAWRSKDISFKIEYSSELLELFMYILLMAINLGLKCILCVKTQMMAY